MQMQSDMKGAVTVLKLAEPLTQQNADDFMAAVRNASERGYGRVVLDTSAMAFVDSRGLESLVELAREMENAGRVLKLCASTSTLREVFNLTGLDDRFELFEDATDAARSFL